MIRWFASNGFLILFGNLKNLLRLILLSDRIWQRRTFDSQSTLVALSLYLPSFSIFLPLSLFLTHSFVFGLCHSSVRSEPAPFDSVYRVFYAPSIPDSYLNLSLVGISSRSLRLSNWSSIASCFGYFVLRPKQNQKKYMH